MREVRTETAALAADAMVVAAGAWSARLTRMLGVELPLATERGCHVTLAEPGVRLSNTVMETDGKFMATRWGHRHPGAGDGCRAVAGTAADIGARRR